MSKKPNKKNEYVEYASQLNKEELAWIKRFYSDYYYYGYGQKNRYEEFLSDPDFKKEAGRNVNMSKTDLYDYKEKEGDLVFNASLFDLPALQATSGWEEIYNKKGYEEALKHVYESAVNDILNSDIDIEKILYRFHIQTSKLDQTERVDRRKNRKK